MGNRGPRGAWLGDEEEPKKSSRQEGRSLSKHRPYNVRAGQIRRIFSNFGWLQEKLYLLLRLLKIKRKTMFDERGEGQMNPGYECLSLCLTLPLVIYTSLQGNQSLLALVKHVKIGVEN